MSNPYYDKKLHGMCRETIRNLLKLYFEFCFKQDNSNFSSSVVRKTNELDLETEDKNISDERLLTLYIEAIEYMDRNDLLLNFCKIPTLFMKDEFGIPFGDDLFDDFSDDEDDNPFLV